MPRRVYSALTSSSWTSRRIPRETEAFEPAVLHLLRRCLVFHVRVLLDVGRQLFHSASRRLAIGMVANWRPISCQKLPAAELLRRVVPGLGALDHLAPATDYRRRSTARFF